MPFAGFSDFQECTAAMSKKGHSDASAKKICGSLQSQAESNNKNSQSEEDDNEKEASLSDEEYFETLQLKSALTRDECEQKAKEFGQTDQDSIDRICDAIVDEDEEEESLESPEEEQSEEQESQYSGQAHPKMLEQCVKVKMKHDDSLSEEDAMSECEKAFKSSASEMSFSASIKMQEIDASLQMQNQHTDPNKLQDYNNDLQSQIDWYSDAEADYNEKSDTKKIDLSYYDDDINKCVEEQVKNGLSQEDARKFCSSLPDAEGDGDIRAPGENPSDEDSEDIVQASVDDLQAYFSKEAKTFYQKKKMGNPTKDMPDVNSLHSEDQANEHDLTDEIDEPDFNQKIATINQELDADGFPYSDDIPEATVEEMNAWFSHDEQDETQNEGKIDGITNNPEQSQQTTQSDVVSQRETPVADATSSGRGRDTTNGGRHQDTGKYVEGHGENDLKNPHSHGLASGSPTYDHFGEYDGNQAGPHSFTTEQNSNLDDNAHIKKNQHPLQKPVDVASESEQPEIGPAPVGASVVKSASTTEYDVRPVTVEYDSPDPIISGKEQLFRSAKSGDEDSQSIIDYIDRHYAGSYDNYINDMQLKPFEQNNKLFVKAFLMDSSVNQNKWGVNPVTLDRNIRSYVGKPLVLQEDFNHPIARPGDDLDLQLDYQELYRVGNIVDVVKKGTRYDAIAEITDDNAKKAFREGNLPLYVSPQLFKLNSQEPDGNMTSWTGTHLAIVKEPAYTVKKATVNGECIGDHATCTSYLRKASLIEDKGYGSCGFCNYKVLVSARPQVKQASTARILTEQDVVPPVIAPQQPVIVQPSGTTTPQVLSSPKLSTEITNSYYNLNEAKSAGELQKEAEKLRGLLLTARKTIDGLKKENEDQHTQNQKLSGRVAAIEMERRKEKISSILQGAYKEEEFTGMVDSFSKSGLPVEDVQKIVQPLIERNKLAAEQEEAAKQQKEVEAQAQELAKSASKMNASQQYTTKVALKNASITPDGSPQPEQQEQVGMPSWLKTRNRLFNDGGII